MQPSALPPRTREPAVSGNEALDHWDRNLLGRQRLGEARGLRVDLGIDKQIAVQPSRNLDRQFDRLVIGGYASDYCVDTTLRAAASRGLAVTVVADGHTTSDRAHLDAAAIVRHHAAIWSTFEASVRVVNSEGIDIQ